MDCTLNLSSLRDLLHKTLFITEKVKEVLIENRDEATFVLKPWQLKTVIEKREHENICNCKEIVNENKTEELVEEIDRAITLAQDLREKVKLNVTVQKGSLKRYPIKNACSNSASIGIRKRVSQKANITDAFNRKTSAISLYSDDKTNTVATKKSISPNRVKSTKQSDATDKVRSKTSLAKITRIKEKNFILENKQNVKKIPARKLQTAGGRDPNNIPGTSRNLQPPTPSAVELSNLIHQVAQRSIESISVFSSNSDKTMCPLHEDTAHRVTQECNTTIDVANALQYFNVPNEIVRALRAYHTFLKIETDSSNDAKKDKNNKSMDNFLTEFEAMNTTVRDRSPRELHLIDLATKSISVFSSTLRENLKRFNNAENTIVESRIVLKERNITEPIIVTSFSDPSLTKEWMSNGIWNISCTWHLKNEFTLYIRQSDRQSFSKAYNVRYSDKEQLLSLYETMQKFQRTKYMNTLIEIILRDVISAIRSTIDPMSTEYVRAYKTISILYQGLNPEIPVLVKTEDDS